MRTFKRSQCGAIQLDNNEVAAAIRAHLSAVLRGVAAVATISWFGCGFRSEVSGSSDASGVDSTPDAADLFVVRIATPAIVVHPGQFTSWCYSDRMPDEEMAIVSWRARLGPGVVEASLLAAGGTQGTLAKCSTEVGPVHLFDAISDGDRLDFPRDEVSGMPVAQHLDRGQPIRIRVVVRGDAAVDLSATAEFVGIRNPDLQVVRSATYLAVNTKVDVLPGDPGHVSTASFGGICGLGIASHANFFSLSVRTHAHGVIGDVMDSGATIIANTSPSIPSARRWPPQVQMADPIQFRCSYESRDTYRIEYGDDPVTQEVCEVVGMYYPSVTGEQSTCLDSNLYQPVE